MRAALPHPVLHLAGVTVAGSILLPLVYLGIRGVELMDGPAPLVLFRVETLWILLRSLALGLGVALLCVAVALPLAWLTHATDLPGRRFFRVALNLPLAVPSFVSGFVVIVTFGPTGALANLLAPLGVDRLPEIYGGTGATLALLFAYPYALIPVQARLARVDPQLWEAARALGASPARAFREIVLPELRPALAGGGLLVVLYVLSDFGAVSLLRFHSLSYVIYLRYRSLLDRGEAVYLGIVLALLALVVLALERRLSGRRRPGVGLRAGARRWPVIALGRWRLAALGLCCLAFGFGVALPAGVVAYWFVRGLSEGNPVGSVFAETLSTVGLAAAASLLVVAVALCPALLLRFGRQRFALSIHAAAHAGYALPGIVVALSLVFLASRHAGWLYQTLALLVFAYVVRFLPLALGALRDGLLSQDPRLYEAARCLGCSPAAAMRRVVLPGLVPAAWAGLLVVFISVIKELPSTLLLRPIGFNTLATRIWSLTEDAFFTAAAPPILALLGLAWVILVLRPDVHLRSEG